ncbi:carboxylesterase family protein [Pseudonocardia sp. N23]|uniref:carboxylesterase family protein n=1 Tax=Pseudonocardia sp. N23 TaxID=1987376 RepID=UPI000BFC134A|nr:carboxylesterase family protein [Pseudonocardia sp. N23]GAY07634.1 carboxylesterase, type B [Pseudonocardia sp. N23]
MSRLTVTLPEGAVQGGWARQFPQVRAFLGLPYAAPPVGCLRFAPPAPCPRSDSWSPLGATVPGALGAAFAEATQLTLDVWTPADAVGRPVLVWLDDEGSAGRTRRFCAGLAAEHRIVVVAPRCRRGALGYLDLTAHRDGFGNGNFGLLDQMEALTWVATHARAFGGDPAVITVSGRGEGAHAAALLAGLPRTSPLVRRLVLPAGVPGCRVQTPAEAARVAAAFLDVLGADPDGRGDLRELEAAAITRAEASLRRAEARSPFALVAHDDLPFGDLTELLRGAMSAVEVMVGRRCVDRGAGTTTWTIWRCGEDRVADRISSVVTHARVRTPEGYGSGFGEFVRTGDPASARGARVEPLLRAGAGREPVDLGAAL